MPQRIASLRNSHQKLVHHLEEMKSKKAELQSRIASQIEEKNHLQDEIERASYRLQRTNENLNKLIAISNEYDKTIADAESACIKIVESSELLVKMMKKESNSVDKYLKEEDAYQNIQQ